MTEIKHFLRKLTLIVPLIFAMVFIAAILFPVAMLVFAVSQIGMPPKAILIFVGSLAFSLDAVAIMKWAETPEIRDRRRPWLLAILLVPYLGSTVFLFKNFREK